MSNKKKQGPFIAHFALWILIFSCGGYFANHVQDWQNKKLCEHRYNKPCERQWYPVKE